MKNMMTGIKLLPLFVALVLPNFVFLTPVPQTSAFESLVIVTTTEINNDSTQETTVATVATPPELKSMHVESNVTNRYAHTVVSSRYKNPADFAQETTFSIILPDTAFISGFSMQIKGKTYEAYVKEKEEAKKDYQQAVQSGLGAGYVEQNARDSNKFTVSVNVEPRSKVTFNLMYEELLVRKHGKYEMVINLHPGQLVKDLTVDVNINETQKLVNVKAPSFRTGNEIIEDNQNNTNEYATITTLDEDGKAIRVHFAPSVQQQKEMAKKLEAAKNQKDDNPVYENPYNMDTKSKKKGLSGQFVIEYDVERNSTGGEVLVNDGYFVHFFAPPELKPLPKHAVFVLDVSGSMMGRKIEQLKQAMRIILDELKPNDYFNLVEFSFGAKVWNFENIAASPIFEETRNKWWRDPAELTTTPSAPLELPPAFPATPENKQKAKDIIEKMEAGGGTNIYDALKVALNLTAAGVPEKENTHNEPQPIVIFLTDGDATDGETDTKIIFNTVSELNEGGKTAIFSLSFGFDANKDFLKKLSLKNFGFMRQIYEASDAALQLQDFYKQISSPLLANVTFKYPEGEVTSLTKQTFHTLFDGAEFIVAGKMENPKDKILYVHGLTIDGPIDFSPCIIPIPTIEINQEIGPLERLWAYMTIKQLLDKKDELTAVESNSTEVDDLNKQALKLALKYSFVTPITSLVVVKPNETEKAINAEESKQGDESQLYAGAIYSAKSFALSTPFMPHGYAAGGYGGGFAQAPVPAPVPSYPGTPQLYSGVDAFDSGIGAPIQSFDTFPSYEEEAEVTQSFMAPMYDSYSELQWLAPLRPNPFNIIIEGKEYVFGDNDTVVDTPPCQVNSLQLNGTCTLLSACPRIYFKLNSYETYVNDYFCTISSMYAGVCCIDLDKP